MLPEQLHFVGGRSLHETLWQFQQSCQFTDLTLSCSDGTIPAHRAMLAGVFKLLGLPTGGQEEEVECLVIPDVVVSEVEQAMEELYLNSKPEQLLNLLCCRNVKPEMVDVPNIIEIKPEVFSDEEFEAKDPVKYYQDDLPNHKSSAKNQKLTKRKEKKSDIKMFQCSECEKQCSTKAGLQDHMLKHSKEKKFVCPECGKKLKRSKNLILHMKLHAGEKNYQCDQCEAKYISSAALRNHTVSKHTDSPPTEQFICSFCGQDFTRKYYLERHIMIHTGEKKYKCNVCPKSFRLETSYVDHMNMHNGIKKFQCPHCEKRFTQRQQMTMHVRRHTGDKRHKCTMCPQAFIEPRSLRNHIKTHESNFDN